MLDSWIPQSWNIVGINWKTLFSFKLECVVWTKIPFAEQFYVTEFVRKKRVNSTRARGGDGIFIYFLACHMKYEATTSGNSDVWNFFFCLIIYDVEITDNLKTLFYIRVIFLCYKKSLDPWIIQRPINQKYLQVRTTIVKVSTNKVFFKLNYGWCQTKACRRMYV